MRSGPLVVLAFAAILGGCRPDRWERWESVTPPDRGTGTVLRGEEAVGPDQLSPEASAVLTGAWVVLTALLLVMVGGRARQYRRRAVATRALAAAPLAGGPKVVVGVIEPDERGAVAAVEVIVHQRDVQQGTTGRLWTETGREVRARSFSLRCDDGVLVIIDPGQAPDVHGELVSHIQHDAGVHTCHATISAGERVWVAGELTGAAQGTGRAAYRDAPEHPVMHPPPGAPIEISTGAPGAEDAREASFHVEWARRIGAVTVLVAFGFLSSYAALALDGEAVEARPEAVREGLTWYGYSTKRSRGGRWLRYAEVRAVIDAGGRPVTVSAPASQTLHACVKYGQCSAVPFVVARHAPGMFHQVGTAPTLDAWRVGLSLLAIAILWIRYGMSLKGRQPWYQVRPPGRLR